MNLDVLVATHERPAMLARTLESLRSAPIPPGLILHVTVVDNGSGTAAYDVVESFMSAFPGRLSYLHEAQPGKSSALNKAIAATDGELIGVIDDDEEIDSGWYEAIAAAFADEHVDFIGGPCLPRWGAVPPNWFPWNWRGVIGVVDDGDRVMVFGKDAPGILMGGNAVMRRRVLEKVGRYVAQLGPSAEHRLLSGEDEELFSRLILAGAHGLYMPELRIYHYVPAERLTKRYYRQWSFWHGVSRSVIEQMRPSQVARIGRVPRYLVGAAFRQTLSAFRKSDHAMRFAAELTVWQVLGFLYGCYWHRRRASS